MPPPTCRHFKPLKLPKHAYSKHLKPRPHDCFNPSRDYRTRLRPGRFDFAIHVHLALAHVSLLLLCAEQTSDEIAELGSDVERGLIWSMVHSVEMARAVMDSLLERAG